MFTIPTLRSGKTNKNAYNSQESGMVHNNLEFIKVTFMNDTARFNMPRFMTPVGYFSFIITSRVWYGYSPFASNRYVLARLEFPQSTARTLPFFTPMKIVLVVINFPFNFPFPLCIWRGKSIFVQILSPTTVLAGILQMLGWGVSGQTLTVIERSAFSSSIPSPRRRRWWCLLSLRILFKLHRVLRDTAAGAR